MSSRRLQGMSSRRLEDVFSVTIFRLPRRLEDVLREVLKTSSRCLGKRKIVTLKTCWRRVEEISWSRLQDVLKTNKCLLGSSFSVVLYERGVLKNFSKFTDPREKLLKIQETLCQSLYFNEVTGQVCNFIKIETLAQVFSCEFCEILRTPFLQNTSGRLLLSLETWNYQKQPLEIFSKIRCS